MDLDFSRQVVVLGETLFREIDGESVILSLETQSYYALGKVGTRMWEVLTTSSSSQAACERLLAEYEVDPLTLRGDLSELITRLLETRLVRLADPPPEPARQS